MSSSWSLVFHNHITSLVLHSEPITHTLINPCTHTLTSWPAWASDPCCPATNITSHPVSDVHLLLDASLGKITTKNKSLVELSLTDSLLCPRINQSRGFPWWSQVLASLPLIFDAMLNTLILKGKLCTDQTARTVWPLCYLMGAECGFWIPHWETVLYITCVDRVQRVKVLGAEYHQIWK